MSGVTPIIAHPERYRLVQNNFNIINEWLNFGCIIQVSAGSILGRMGKDIEKTALKIINNNQCQILGSDAHNNMNRNFLLKDAYNFIEKIIGKSAIKLVLDNPKAVLEGTEITANNNLNIPNKKLSLLNWFKIKK
jgi:protein-tyrosine phosphatase